ncbi:MAG TPA: hypothetical protein VMR33_10500 [Candidatus Baltobacteraceae bacterium]|jgi:hypothetical protein|nr:hypothetical protein [Candidatus Baltobacteraceae bacterium]
MKPKKLSIEPATKAALMAVINKAAGYERTRHGPEPERLKITGCTKWEDAAAALVRAKKPRKGWPKR